MSATCRRMAAAAGWLLLGCGLALAQVPAKISYQGRLLKGTVPVNGVTNIVAKLYTAAGGGVAVYAETNSNVVVNDGLYNFMIGDEAAGLSTALTNSPLYLELTVGATTLTPREEIVAVAYAVRAASVPPGTITSAMIADGAVTNADLANGAVTAAKMAGGAALGEILDDDGAGSGLDADALDGQHASAFATSAHNHDATYVNEGQADSVTSAMIVNGAVANADLANGAVTAAKMAAGAALSEIADDDGVGSGLDADLLDGNHAVGFATSGHNHDGIYAGIGVQGCVDSWMILNGTVTNADLANGAVTATKLADGAVTAAKMADGAALSEILDNDGGGSGLDADFLDGNHGSYYRVIVAQSQTGYTTPIRSGVTNYEGGTVTITAPRSGRIVVEANAWVQLGHVNGADDILWLGIGTSPTDLGDAFGRVAWEIPSAYPSSSATERTFTVRRAFSVAAGTYTYYLNGVMDAGGTGDDQFWFAEMLATFYPGT